MEKRAEERLTSTDQILRRSNETAMILMMMMMMLLKAHSPAMTTDGETAVVVCTVQKCVSQGSIVQEQLEGANINLFTCQNLDS